MDILSDVLKTVRLTGAAYFDVVTRAPWVAEQPTCDLVLPLVRPGAQHLVSYHVVTEGSCFASLIDGQPLEVKGGEVIVFTRGDPHVLSSAPGMRAAPVTPDDFRAAMGGPLPFSVEYGERGPVSAKLVCGFLACDATPFNPLLNQLPAVIKTGGRSDHDDNWLSQFIRVAQSESSSGRAGRESVLAKLSELMFVEVIRRHLESLPPEQAGWLAGLRDPYVGKALALMHREPARDWTIEALAREVALSRSVLAERFADLLGMGPMHYLSRWRMQIAAGLLSGGGVNIAEVAAQTGYGSEAAFSRAFKKVVGVPPSAWRQGERGAQPA